MPISRKLASRICQKTSNENTSPSPLGATCVTSRRQEEGFRVRFPSPKTMIFCLGETLTNRLVRQSRGRRCGLPSGGRCNARHRHAKSYSRQREANWLPPDSGLYVAYRISVVDGQ